MSAARKPTKSVSKKSITVVGIDVGGRRKGFHAVVLTDGKYACHRHFLEVKDLALWCINTIQTDVIAIDAPCRWSQRGHARKAEKDLKAIGISCFSTPTRKTAVDHIREYYEWMLMGESLFRALKTRFPLLDKLPRKGQRCCFETYPHAITCHLRGDIADASKKRVQRRELLERAGIDLTRLTNIDLVDAALCALTAYHAALGRKCVPFGEPDTGLIIVSKKRNS